MAEEAEGTELHFCGLVGEPDHRIWRAAYKARPGYALVHLGRQRHGVLPVTDGERRALIMGQELCLEAG